MFTLTGAELFATTDAGRTWQQTNVRTPPGMSIDAKDCLSPTIGWAEAAGPAIGDPNLSAVHNRRRARLATIDFQP